MNRKFLMLLALMPFVGVSSANALVYHYDVDFKIGSATVTGMITTSSDSGHLPEADILSYAFLFNGGSGFSGTTSNISNFSGGPILASPTTLSFAPSGLGSITFNASTSTSTQILMIHVSHINELEYVYHGATLASAATPPPYQIATIAAVPLPAALPLFAGGLGVMGFLARRRKRAAAAAA